MKKKKFWLLLAVLIVFNVGVFFFASKSFTKAIKSFEECVLADNIVLESYPPQCKTKDGKLFTQNIGNEMELIDKIIVFSPRPNKVIASPLSISGKARGTWFFEAQFSAKLMDANNKELGKTVITADGEWMTEEFVPYSGKLTFTKPTTANGTLILEKANPSGMKDKAEQLEIPVSFK